MILFVFWQSAANNSAFFAKEWLNNTVSDYLVALAWLITMLVLMRFVVNKIVDFLYNFFVKGYMPNANREAFNKLLVRPIQLLFFLLTMVIVLKALHFPDFFEGNIAGYNFEALRHGFYKVVFVLGLIWIIFRILDFASLVLSARVSNTESRADDQVLGFARDFLKIIIFFIGFIFILSHVFKFDVSALLTGAGIIGIAVALAAKESLENLLATIIIIAEQPFILGDYIDAGNNIQGRVEYIGFRSTRLRTLERTYITIPNRTIINAAVENQSLRNSRRVKIQLILSHNNDSAKLRQLLDAIKTQLTKNYPLESPPVAVFSEFVNNNVKIIVECYLADMKWPLFVSKREDINFTILDIIQQHQFELSSEKQTQI
ncbi:MAG: mechanosensitive ion channel [Sphingobacteriales bacterium]|jgi:MscS family membrane protein|nr:mechanosensitive ion channel [Sphingobacteriales bacterium]MBP9142606.1 mechanosensitive ion channel [Chitinophagales bacterium]MDA0199511.1 mechanosensitive ion channel family protein [Bacteroidota bacterium]MBK6891536.1 mechanosensitive ion channel [Sphingobacteriales bacterium]MBK7526532.1 mechanosensitive ion channel [Sphingobacteriales bacterium]